MSIFSIEGAKRFFSKKAPAVRRLEQATAARPYIDVKAPLKVGDELPLVHSKNGDSGWDWEGPRHKVVRVAQIYTPTMVELACTLPHDKCGFRKIVFPRIVIGDGPQGISK